MGNEILMQKKINLNIQIPHDESSVLEMHADSFSGESNFEVITWLPLVNVRKTKSMYVMNLKNSQKIENKLLKYNKLGTDKIYSSYKKKFKFLNLKFGELLIFSSNILHGNKKNLIEETRWSLNCRYKSIFSPNNQSITYKNFSSMYENIGIKPATIIGLDYYKL